MVSKGRVPGRELTDLEVRYLSLLIELHQEAKRIVAIYDVRLEDFVLECRESGASARGMAAVLGVSSGTVQGWKTKAKQRRDG